MKSNRFWPVAHLKHDGKRKTKKQLGRQWKLTDYYKPREKRKYKSTTKFRCQKQSSQTTVSAANYYKWNLILINIRTDAVTHCNPRFGPCTYSRRCVTHRGADDTVPELFMHLMPPENTCRPAVLLQHMQVADVLRCPGLYMELCPLICWPTQRRLLRPVQ